MISHLLEIRRRLLRISIVFFVFFMILAIFANTLFETLMLPLFRHALPHAHLIATNMTSPFFAPLQLAWNVTLLLVVPYALMELWQFIAPGLYPHEKHPIRQYIGLSVLLFLCGMVFCFYVVLPMLFHFFSATLPDSVQLMPDIMHLIEFVTSMLLRFGVCFQLPLLCIIGVRLQWFTPDQLCLYRPYAIVAAFILGMILTPPDVLSQLTMAIPLWGLYELGILLSRRTA
ncbi:MAG: twin-arginine translocase subunit TatC [Legionellaceae bacterium]|nr:twin-arginine translocase subunit TatC [Legionellaceae bacterium]